VDVWSVVSVFFEGSNILSVFNSATATFELSNNLTMKQDDQGLIKLGEACKILNVHPQTLRQWDKKGILKAVRFGQRGDRRYKKEDIEKLTSKAK
jgi:excisionase family DNA binding protein